MTAFNVGRDQPDDGVYHSISGPCQTFEDDKNGIAPIYESIEHPTMMGQQNQASGKSFISMPF